MKYNIIWSSLVNNSPQGPSVVEEIEEEIVEEEYYVEVEGNDQPEKPKKPKKEPKKKENILEYDESIIGGLPEDYQPIGDEPEYDEVPLIESLSWFDYDVQLKGTDLTPSLTSIKKETHSVTYGLRIVIVTEMFMLRRPFSILKISISDYPILDSAKPTEFFKR